MRLTWTRQDSECGPQADGAFSASREALEKMTQLSFRGSVNSSDIDTLRDVRERERERERGERERERRERECCLTAWRQVADVVCYRMMPIHFCAKTYLSVIRRVALYEAEC